MQFIFPSFLFALLSLAIPVVIHLFHLRKITKVYFSNVQFLKELQQQQSSQKKLKRRLILLMRLLALAFLVLAFAKPYFPSRDIAGVGGQQQAISIFIDNSQSMQTINREGTLLTEAKLRAKELVSTYGLNDKFQLLTHDFEGVQQRLLSRNEFYEEVDKIKISPQSRKLDQIIERQQTMLNTHPEMAKRIYILSDFQKNQIPANKLVPEKHIPITLIKLKATPLPNVTVDSAWLVSAVHSPGASEKLVVALHNYAQEKAEKVPVKLIINGVQKSLGSFTIDARSVQMDTLSFSGLTAGWQKAEIQLQDNPITFDNRFFLAFRVQHLMKVLLVDGGTPNKFLISVFNSDPFFSSVSVHDGNVDYARLSSYPFIVLSDIKSLSNGLAQQLNNYVKNGGTLAVFPAEDADLPSYRTLLQPMGSRFPEALVSEIGRVNAINLQSNIFRETFEQLPKDPDLPMVLKYYRMSTGNRTSGETLLELPGKQPFMSSFRYGNGQIYLSAVALSETYSNLSRHALFVPLVLRMALLSGHDQPLFHTIGEDEIIETLPIQASDREMIKLLRHGQIIIPDLRQNEGSTALYFSDQVQQPGNYELVKKDSIIANLAFNYSRSESDLSYLEGSELKREVPGANTTVTTGLQTGKQQLENTSSGLELWRICLILCLIFLGGEMLVVKLFRPEVKTTEP